MKVTVSPSEHRIQKLRRLKGRCHKHMPIDMEGEPRGTDGQRDREAVESTRQNVDTASHQNKISTAKYIPEHLPFCELVSIEKNVCNLTQFIESTMFCR